MKIDEVDIDLAGGALKHEIIPLVTPYVESFADTGVVSSLQFVRPDAADARDGIQAFLNYLMATGSNGYMAAGHYHLQRGISLANVNGLTIEFAPGTIFDFDKTTNIGNNGWNINECSNLTLINPPEMRMNYSVVRSGGHAVVFRNPNPGLGAPNGTINVIGTWKIRDWGDCCFLIYHGSSWPNGTDTGGNVFIQGVDARGVMDSRGGPSGGYASFANNGFLFGGVKNCSVGYIYISNVWDDYLGSGPAYALQCKGLDTVACAFEAWEAENCMVACASGLEVGDIGAMSCRWGEGTAIDCPTLYLASGGTDHQIGVVHVRNSIEIPGSYLVRISGNSHRCTMAGINARGVFSSTGSPLTYISGDENYVNYISLDYSGARRPYVEFHSACDRNMVIVNVDQKDSNTSFPTLIGRVVDNSSRKNNVVMLQGGQTWEIWRNGATGHQVLDQRYGSLAPYPTKSMSIGRSSNRFSVGYLGMLDLENNTTTAVSATSNDGRVGRFVDIANGLPGLGMAVNGSWRQVLAALPATVNDPGGSIPAGGSLDLALSVPGVLSGDILISCECTQNFANGVIIQQPPRITADGVVTARVANFTGSPITKAAQPWRVITAAAGLHPYAKSLIARFSSAPSAYVTQWVNRTVIDLVDAGIWSLLDVLHMYCLYDTQSIQRNWIKNSHNATTSGSPTITPYSGITGNSANSAYITTGYAPATDAVNMSQDFASIGAYKVSTNIATGSYLVGQNTSTGGAYTRHRPRFVGDLFQGRINGTTSVSFPDVTSSIGLSVITRFDANTVSAYVRGLEVGTDEANVSAGMPTATLTCLRDVSVYSDETIAAFLAGGALDAQKQADLNSIVEAFYQAMVAHP